MRRLGYLVIAISLAGTIDAAPPRVQSNRQEVNVPGLTLRSYETPYYYFHTDLDEDDAKEAVIRMTKMFEAYRSRTADLFMGRVSQKLSFYLFSKGEDYYTAGGLPGSAGVFDGQKLMAMAIRDSDGKVGIGTWHVVQHEGFHQFVANVIRGQIPVWVNEGLAEYFGEAIFTGDGMVTGLIGNGRLKRVQRQMKDGKFKSVKEMMQLTHEAWNNAMDITNYDQAWSMVHFLAAGDDGKYRDAFVQFLQLISRGKQWDQAWLASFGSANGFEEKWKAYWLGLPENPTLDLFAEADVAALTSFMGRAYGQKQGFDDFKDLLRSDGKDLKSAPTDWLPPQLFDEMKDMAAQLQSKKAGFVLEKGIKGSTPKIVCSLEDGTKITGTFDSMANGRIGKVGTMMVKPTPKKPDAAK